MKTQTSPNSAYDFRIDAIRGIACLLLVAFHVIGEQPTHGLRVEFDHPLSMFAEIFIHLRMPLFAMLSGFVYAYRPAEGSQIGGYFKGKGRRLVLPYLFAATAFALVNSVLGGAYAVAPADFWQVYVLSYSQFWFIQSVLILFVVVGLMDAVFGAHRVLPMLVLFLASWAAFLSPLAEGVQVFSADRALYLAPFFIGGALLNRARHLIPAFLPWAIAVAALVGLGIHAVDTINEPGLTSDRRTYTGLFLALALSSGLVLFRFRNVLLERIGRYSYAIYLYHIFAVFGLQAVYDFTGMPSPWLGLALGVGLGIILPIIAEEAARIVGRWIPWLPVFTLGVKPKPRAEQPSLNTAEAARA